MASFYGCLIRPQHHEMIMHTCMYVCDTSIRWIVGFWSEDVVLYCTASSLCRDVLIVLLLNIGSFFTFALLLLHAHWHVLQLVRTRASSDPMRSDTDLLILVMQNISGRTGRSFLGSFFKAAISQTIYTTHLPAFAVPSTAKAIVCLPHHTHLHVHLRTPPSPHSPNPPRWYNTVHQDPQSPHTWLSGLLPPLSRVQ